MTIFTEKVNPPLSIIAPKRGFGAFSAYLTISEKHEDTIEITNHPVQQGASITDHAYKNPSKVSAQIQFDRSTDSLQNIYQRLLDLQASRVLIDLTTGKRAYSSMLIKSLSVDTDATTENVLRINIDFQEVAITATSTVTVTRVRNAKGLKGLQSKAVNGTKSATPKTPPAQETSALKDLFG